MLERHKEAMPMAKPLIKIAQDKLHPTVVALSNAGATTDDADWLRKQDNAPLVVQFMRERQKAQNGKAETFKREQVESNCGYPSGWSLKPLSEQVAILLQYFPDLDISHVEELGKRYEKDGKLVLPQGMDGLVVIPKPSVVAKLLEDKKDWPTYNRAIKCLLGVMATTRRSIANYTDGRVGPEFYNLVPQTAEAYAKLEELPGEMMVLAVQTGILHRGKSARRARVTFGEREFGLDAFAVGCIILTHPERLQSSDALFIDCSGSEMAPEADDNFDHVPHWFHHTGALSLESSWVGNDSANSGSASAAVFPEG
jgi:hypothetical protein